MAFPCFFVAEPQAQNEMSYNFVSSQQSANSVPLVTDKDPQDKIINIDQVLGVKLYSCFYSNQWSDLGLSCFL